MAILVFKGRAATRGHDGGGKRQAMSGSMVLQHPGPMLVSIASVTIEGDADNWGLIKRLMLVSEGHTDTGARLIWMTCAATQSHIKAQCGAMSRSMALLQPGSALISVAPNTSKGCENTWVRWESEGHAAARTMLI